MLLLGKKRDIVKNKTFGVLLGLSIVLPMIFIPLLIVFPHPIALFFFAAVEGSLIGATQSVWKKINNKIDNKDNIQYCPNCGSRNIKIYREGYDYNKGYWYRVFGVKGGGYVAGMNSNRARCHCMNCGKDWATNYDYRLIDK